MRRARILTTYDDFCNIVVSAVPPAPRTCSASREASHSKFPGLRRLWSSCLDDLQHTLNVAPPLHRGYPPIPARESGSAYAVRPSPVPARRRQSDPEAGLVRHQRFEHVKRRERSVQITRCPHPWRGLRKLSRAPPSTDHSRKASRAGVRIQRTYHVQKASRRCA